LPVVIDGLARLAPGTVFLIGGSANISRAEHLLAQGGRASVINACGLGLVEALALLRQADLFVGPDSGPMNLAVAAGTPAFVLFGLNRVLRYSRFIHPVVPPGGQSPDGMSRISPTQVLAQVGAYLAELPLH
jgi:ADP-heptose:LPS heptosyltransferase